MDRGSMVAGIALGLAACGPTLGEPVDDGGGSGTAVATAADATTTTSLDSGGSDGPRYDLPSFDFEPMPPPDDPGRPPDTCRLPMEGNGMLVGTTPLGDVQMEAAVFARTGGGKCPWAYRIVVAASPAELAAVVLAYEEGAPIADAVEITLELPVEGPVPGTWTGRGQHIQATDSWSGDAVADVSIATRLDVPMPMLETAVTITDVDGGFELSGFFTVPYCAAVHGWECGIPK